MIRSLLFGSFRGIKREEWPRVLLLATFFFLLIGTYWVLKPIKRGVIISFFGGSPLELFGMAFTGAEAEQLGKVLDVAFAYLAVLVFTWLSRRCPRRYLVAVFAAFFGSGFLFYATVIDELTEPIVWSFYVMGDMFNTLMVAVFWAFTNDLTTSEASRRTYGVIGLGGVVGGFVGATAVSAGVEAFGRAPLLVACVVPMVLVAVIAFWVERVGPAGSDGDGKGPASDEGDADQGPGGSAWHGLRLVLSSKYLLAIAAIIGSYELVSNIIDFQLSATVEARIAEPLEKDAFFALVGQVIGVGSIVVQLLLTTYVLRRYSVRVALLFLPLAILVSTVGFIAVPTLLFAAAMSTSDNALNYSINQSAKEALYVPTAPEVTYQAKAFIDVLWQRMAKVASVAINLVVVHLVVDGVRWLSAVTLGVLVVWFAVVFFIERGYQVRRAWEARHA